MQEEFESEMPDLNGFPVPEPREGDELEGALYDSAREYIEQIRSYKAFQGRESPAGLTLLEFDDELGVEI